MNTPLQRVLSALIAGEHHDYGIPLPDGQTYTWYENGLHIVFPVWKNFPKSDIPDETHLIKSLSTVTQFARLCDLLTEEELVNISFTATQFKAAKKKKKKKE